MTTHAVLETRSFAALNVDSFGRHAICSGSDVDNGNVFRLDTISSTSGEGEDWVVTKPTTSGSTLNRLWMAFDSNANILSVNGKNFKGLTQDPRDFTNVAGYVFSAFKPQVGDILVLTAEAMTGAKGGSDTFVNATDASFTLAWGTTQTASALSMKLVGTDFISIGSGAIDSQRVTAYKFEVLAN